MKTRKRKRVSWSDTTTSIHEDYCTSFENTLCLICHLSTELVSNRDNFTSNRDHLKSKQLSNDISAYFLLKHILDVPSEQLAWYLSKCSFLGDCVKVCSVCYQNYVNDCNQIFVEYLKSQNKFNAARNRVIVAIKKSVENESKIKEYNVSEEIRRLVVQRHGEQSEHEKNSLAGDLLAADKHTANQTTGSKKLSAPSTQFKQEPETQFCNVDIDIKMEQPVTQCLSGDVCIFQPSDDENESDDPHDDDWNVDEHSDDEEFLPNNKSRKKQGMSRASVKKKGAVEKLKPITTTATAPVEKQPAGGFQCSQCPKSFSTLKHLSQHKRGSHTTDVHLCPEPGCGWKTHRIETLRCHIKRYHGCAEDLLKLTCPICKKILSKTAHLNRHIAHRHKHYAKPEQPLTQCLPKTVEQGSEDISTTPEVFQPSDNENEDDDPRDDDWNVDEHSDDEEFLPKNKSRKKGETSHAPVKNNDDVDKLKPNTTTTTTPIEKQPTGEFQCDECPKSFSTLKNLRKHKSGSHTTDVHVCPEPGCGFKTHRVETLRCHTKRYHGTAEDILKLTCPICKKVLSKTAHLNFHIAHRHSANGNFKCDICDKMFAEEISLRSHQAQTHDMTEYQRYLCTHEKCDKGFYLRSNLLKHKISHQTASHECDICGKKLKSAKSLKTHLSTHQEQEPGTMFQCDKCPKQFETRKSLSVHCQKKHNPFAGKVKVVSVPGVLSVLGEDHTGPFRCEHDGCCRIYASYKSYRRHRLKHNPEPPTSHTCDECGKEFKQRNNLRIHVRRVHQGIKKIATEEQREKTRRRQRLYYQRTEGGPHKCSQCDLVFPNPSVLQRHSKLKHPKEFPFNCELCGKGLLYPSWLREHRAEMHHICSVEDCQLNCENRNGLWTHQKEAHGKEVDVFSCGECAKLFIRPRKLREHQKLHEYQRRLKEVGEEGGSASVLEDWICDLCGKGFILKKYLTYHTWHTHKKLRKPKNKKAAFDGGYSESGDAPTFCAESGLSDVKSDDWL